MNTEQEPQAQADPEVVAWFYNQDPWGANTNDIVFEDPKDDRFTPLITLQSHREAMAYAKEFYEKKKDLEYTEAIAKKDDALDACVEALGTCRIMSKDNDGNYTIEVTPKIITSAITQAKGARK